MSLYRLTEPGFAEIALTQNTKKKLEMLTVDEVTKLGKPYIGVQFLFAVSTNMK